MVEWIPVKERLPKDGEVVLIIAKQKIEENGVEYTINLVTHWADDNAFKNNSYPYGEVVAWMSPSALLDLWTENQ